VLARVFPANVRYTGLPLAYQLCSLVVGSGTPVLAQAILNATGSITGVAIASALYACASLVCMLALLQRTGYRASDLSTAERADLAESDDNEGGVGANPEAGEPRGWRPV